VKKIGISAKNTLTSAQAHRTGHPCAQRQQKSAHAHGMRLQAPEMEGTCAWRVGIGARRLLLAVQVTVL